MTNKEKVDTWIKLIALGERLAEGEVRDLRGFAMRGAGADVAETFGSKLKQMRKDLASIVDRMNRDKSYDAAQAAQNALVQVSALEHEIENIFGDPDDTAWDWEPTADD